MYEKDSRNVVKALSAANFKSPVKNTTPVKMNTGVSGVRKIVVKKLKP